MKRIASMVGAIAVLLGVLVVVAPAEQAGAISYNYANMTWLRNNLTNFSTGPAQSSGYGRVVLTGFPKATCDGCTWYSITRSITNHQPTLAVRNADGPPAPNTVQPNSGFCWPWDWGNWFGDGCWNNINSWDWPVIFSHINGGYHPWDSHSTIDNIEGCLQGVYKGTITVVGKPAIGWLLDNADLLRVNPAGNVYAVLGGCISYFLY
jgi:hypothetical protein